MKVKVRIAVAVGRSGDYNARGWHCKVTDQDAPMDFAVEGLDEQQWREAWVTAEIEVPDFAPVEVAGQQEVVSE